MRQPEKIGSIRVFTNHDWIAVSGGTKGVTMQINGQSIHMSIDDARELAGHLTEAALLTARLK